MRSRDRRVLVVGSGDMRRSRAAACAVPRGHRLTGLGARSIAVRPDRVSVSLKGVRLVRTGEGRTRTSQAAEL